MARKNIKVPESLFESLKADKPESVTWPEYLEARCLLEVNDPEPRGKPDTNKVMDELETIQRAVKTVEKHTGTIQRDLEKLQR